MRLRTILLLIALSAMPCLAGQRHLLLCVETNAYGVPSDYTHYWAPSLTGLSDNGPGRYLSELKNTATLSANGYNLSSNTAYVQLPGRFTNGVSYTVMAKVYPDFSKMNANVSGGWILADRDTSAAGKLDMQLYYTKALGKLGFTVGITNSTTLVSVYGPVVTNVQFYHLAAVVDGTNVSLYLDSNLVAFTNTPATVSDGSTVAMRIGEAPWTASPGGTSTKFYGYIDMVRLYKRALSSNEVAAIHRKE